MARVSLDIQLNADGSGLIRGMRLSRRQIQMLRDDMRGGQRDAGLFSDALKGIGGTLGDVRGNIAGFAAAGAAAFGLTSAIQATRDFEKALSTLRSITGASKEDLDFYSDAAKEFGETTSFSASQAVEAFQLVASAKPDLLESRDALKAVTAEVVTLASAADMDLSRAASALAVSLNQFNVGAEESARFINVLAAGSKFGSSKIEETADAIAKVGGVASNLGRSFEETNAAIQVLAKGGLFAAEAGTQLKGVLAILGKDADDKINPSMRSLSDVFLELKSRGMGFKDALEKFGSINVNAALNLINNAEALGDLEKNITGSSVAYEQAAINADNLDGSIAGLMSKVEGLQIAVGDRLRPALRAAIDGLGNFLVRVKDLIVVLGDIGPILKIVGVGGALWAGMLAAPAIIGGVSVAVGGLATAWLAVKTVMLGNIPVMVALNTAMFGTSAAALAATGAVGKLAVASGVLFAAWAGWEIGTMLRDRFEFVRVAGLEMVEALLLGWEELKRLTAIAAAWVLDKWADAMSAAKIAAAKTLEIVARGMAFVPGMTDQIISLTSAAVGLRSAAKLGASDFASEQKKINAEADKAKDSIKGVISALVDEEIQLGTTAKATASMAASVKKLGKKSEESKKGVDDLGSTVKSVTGSMKKAASEADKLGKKALDMLGALSNRAETAGLDSAQKKIIELQRVMRDSGKFTAEQIQQNSELAQKLISVADAREKAATADRNARDRIDGLREEISLLKILDKGERERAKFLQDIPDALRDEAGALFDVKKAHEETAKAAKDGADAAKKAYKESFADLEKMSDSFFDSLLSGSGSFKDAFKGLGQDLIGSLMQDIKGKASGQLSSLLGGLLSPKQAGPAQPGMLDSLGSLFSGGKKGGILDSVSGLFGGAGDAIKSGIGKAFAPIAKAFAPVTKGLSSVTSAVGGAANAMGIAGAAISALSGDKAGAVAGAGGVLGNMLLPGLGGVIGSFLGDKLGGVLFGKWEVVATGIRAKINGFDADFDKWVKERKKGLGGSKTRTKFSGLGGEAEAGLKSGFGAAVGVLDDLGDLLKIDLLSDSRGLVRHIQAQEKGFQEQFASATGDLIQNAVAGLQTAGAAPLKSAEQLMRRTLSDFTFGLFDRASQVAFAERGKAATGLDPSQDFDAFHEFDRELAKQLFDGVRNSLDSADLSGLGAEGISQQIFSSLTDQLSGVEGLELPPETVQRLSDILSLQLSDAVAGIGTVDFDPRFLANFKEIINATEGGAEVVAGVVQSMLGLRDTFNLMRMDTGLVTQSLIEAKNGFAGLQGQLDFFYRQFLPEATRNEMQFEFALGQVQSAFAALGMEIPDTRAAFVDLVTGLDAAEQGADGLLSALLDVAPALDTVFAQAEKDTAEVVRRVQDSGSRIAPVYQSVNDTIKANANSLLDFARSLTFGDSSTLKNEESLARAEETFIRTLAAAQRGDEDALGNIQGVTETFRQLAKDFFGDSDEFQAIERRTRGNITALASRNASAGDVMEAVGSSPLIIDTSSGQSFQEMMQRLKVLEDMLTEQRRTNDMLNARMEQADGHLDATLTAAEDTARNQTAIADGQAVAGVMA